MSAPVVPLPVGAPVAASVAPTSEEALIALVREAAAAGRPIATVGNQTKRHHGPALGAAHAQVISLRQLARVTAHDPGDMVVSVEAGLRLAELQRQLAQRGQWLPIDAPYADATIGGILATASAGPRRLGYGTIKDHLLGLRVVGASGTITKSGGRVVKNVTGYDLHKLHVGAFGTLGVILEAHFKVQPRPELSGAVVFGFSRFADAHRLLLDVWGSALRPVALEALAGMAAKTLRLRCAGLPPGDAFALVGIEGSAPVFERHLRGLEPRRAAAGGMGVLRGPAADALWSALRDGPDRHREDVVVRLGARPRELPDLLGALGGDFSMQAHVGNGVARVHLPRTTGAEIARRVAGWQERAAARGGYAVVESAPPNLDGRAALPWAGRRVALAAAIKAKWDPAQLLNPGRAAL